MAFASDRQKTFVFVNQAVRKRGPTLTNCAPLGGTNVVSILAYVMFLCCPTATPLMAQDSQKPAAASTETQTAEQKAWRQAMSRRPLPKNGCFTASYPSTEWREVQCGRSSPYHNKPRGGRRSDANLVGDGNDFVAKTSGLISSATGAFLSPTSASGENGDVAGTTTWAANIFTLQINTQSNFLEDGSTFSTAACNGHIGCFGWQQFVFSQTQGGPPQAGQTSAAPGVTRSPITLANGVTIPGGESTPGLFIEYWLMNYGTPCPTLPSWAIPPGLPATTTWVPDGAGNCWFNGPMTYVHPLTVDADFVPLQSWGLEMTGTANASQDKLVLWTSKGSRLHNIHNIAMYAYQEPSVLGLSAVWTEAEFNVFGDCCGTSATFTSPTVLVVQTSIDDGTKNAPVCVPNDGTTGETNNLTFAEHSPPFPGRLQGPVCCPYGGTSPAIEFMEALDTSHGHTASCGPTTLE